MVKTKLKSSSKTSQTAPFANLASRPLIGVLSTSLDLISSRTGFAELLRLLEQGVAQAGGQPYLFGLPGTKHELAVSHQGTRYYLPIRDLVADFVECLVRMHGLDGIVFMSDCESSTAGVLMASARLNIPVVILPFGLEGPYARHVMATLSQALGLSAGGCTEPSPAADRRALASTSGRLVVEAVRNNLMARRILTQSAFHNAIAADMALGGTSTAALHLSAIAYEAGVTLPLVTFDEIARETPQLCSFDGTQHTVKDLYRAGGVLGVLQALGSAVKPSLTVTGKNITELVQNISTDKEIIRANKPYRKEAGLSVLFGNLAPSGCIVHGVLEKGAPQSVEGPARVFNSEEEALQAIAEKKTKAKEVLVIRYEGPKGGPGMRELTLLSRALKEFSKGRWAAVVTDGRLGDECQGLCVSHISPEAAEGGSLAILRDGDMLQVDLLNRQLNVRLTNMEIKVRLARWQSPTPQISTGILSRYARDVMPAESGAVLK